MKKIRLGCIVAGASLISSAPFNVLAEDTYQLGDITVQSTRVEESQYKVPAAIGVVDRDDIQLGRQQLGLDESLVKIPGIFAMNRYNSAQDLRISIRGFGARAPFGIRGVKIFADGIPSTLADGSTSAVSDIDIGSAQRIEVLRGPASSLYGSASGGAINIYTEDGPETPFVEGRLSIGEYSYDKEQIKAGGQSGKLNYLVNFSRTEMDGFRDHNESKKYLFNSKFRYDITSDSSLTVVASAIDAPTNNDPGGINAAAVAADPTQARQRNVDFNAGEEFDQQKLGLVYQNTFNEKHAIRLRNYYIARDFNGRLPFTGSVAEGNGGQIEFDRFFFGGGADYTYTDNFAGHDNRLIVGFDIDKQDDDRQRFENNSGVRGNLTLDQNEEVTSYGIFIQDEFQLNDSLELTAGVRYDVVDFDVEDRFLANAGGNESGSLSFHEWNPRVGLLWSLNDAVNVYTSYSTSFETPGTTDFSNPNGGGLNPDLNPQTAKNYEVGIKGVLPARISYEIAIFHIDVEDELIGFELAGQPDREFFENAGESTHDGIEVGFSVQPSFFPGLTASIAYTYSDFEFDSFSTRDGDVFDGNTIPGIPEHQFHGEVSYYHPGGMYTIFEMQHVGSMYVNNSNTTEIDAYQVANLRVGFLGEFGNWEITPFMGLNNLFDEEYSSNIRINAFGGRFFEPAPERNFYAGITARMNFGQ